MLNRLVEMDHDVLALHHAEAILTQDMPTALEEIEDAVSSLSIPLIDLIHGGGGEGSLTQQLRKKLEALGWSKHTFSIVKIVDGVKKDSTTHVVDHVKSFNSYTIALEIEWNNKDPFFDRDLDNFKRLHAEGAISVGVIITRGRSLQQKLIDLVSHFAYTNNISSIDDLYRFYKPTDRQIRVISRQMKVIGDFPKAWANAFVSDKFGKSTTHWDKLKDRVERGVGNPCPLLLIGLSHHVVSY